MKIFDVVEYKRTVAIITDLPTPTTCKVFYEYPIGKFNVYGAERKDVTTMKMPEDFTKGTLCEAVRLFQQFSQMLNLPTE